MDITLIFIFRTLNSEEADCTSVCVDRTMNFNNRVSYMDVNSIIFKGKLVILQLRGEVCCHPEDPEVFHQTILILVN